MAAQFVSLSSRFSVSLFSPLFTNSPAFPVSYKAFLSSFPRVTLSSPRSVYESTDEQPCCQDCKPSPDYSKIIELILSL